MELETLKQWMAAANFSVREDADGYLELFRSGLEISVAYLPEANLVVCFAPLLELEGLETAARLEALEQALSLNGVGSLPPGCALSYDADGEVVYLLWQESPEQLSPAAFENAFGDFETAAVQAQGQLRGAIAEGADGSDDFGASDFGIKV